VKVRRGRIASQATVEELRLNLVKNAVGSSVEERRFSAA
jgi:hypothetical protein